MSNVCVIGLGQIGLPLALVLSKANHRVFGVDASEKRLKKIRNFASESSLISEKRLLERYLDKQLFLSNDLYYGLSAADVVFVAIGTGISLAGEADLSNMFGLFEKICVSASYVKGKLFVIKSTLPLGTTRKIGSLMEKATGLRCGEDFQLAFCPERVLGDRAVIEMESLPKVIGGINQISGDRAVEIYQTIGGKIVRVESPEAAEFIKLIDNSYRQTLFAFSNDLAMLADHLGINSVNLIRAANDSYPRNNIPLPSPGVSGYCLTKDPLYLEAAFKPIVHKRGFSSVWYYARKSNDYMPVHVVNVLSDYLKQLNLDLNASTVLVCGISYKENVDDIRFSHGLEIASMLKKNGAKVYVWDPIVTAEDVGFTKIKHLDDVCADLDALVFTVKHDVFFSYNEEIVQFLEKMRHPIIIDGWGIFKALVNNKKVRYAGIGIFNNLSQNL